VSKYTKEQLIEFATTHADMAIRQSAAEALYQLGRVDGANAAGAAIERSPTRRSSTSSREGM
jgi:hypothetical protein